MYEVKQAAVQRAIDILRGGALTAAGFAMKMWPDRDREGSQGRQAQAGHAFLRRLGALGYVDHVGDLWTIRSLSANGSANPSGTGSSDLSAVGLANGSASHLLFQQGGALPERLATEPVEQQRLVRLVGQATEPVGTVSHDAAFGNLAVRAVAVDVAIVEACAFVVLLGRNTNVYPPCGAPGMIVGLSPAEGARVLFLRWQQSGAPPDPPRPGAWIRVPDGIVACPGFWRPAGAPAGWVDPEDVRVRIGRQRAAAGLA
jgi:hypothetical protein